MVNETRAVIEAFWKQEKKMEKAIREEKMKKEVIDVTLPAKKQSRTSSSEYRLHLKK